MSMSPYMAKCIEVIDELMQNIAGPARDPATAPAEDDRCHFGFAQYRDYRAKDKENNNDPGFDVYNNWATPGIGGNGYAGSGPISYASLLALSPYLAADQMRDAVLYGGGTAIGFPRLETPFFVPGPNSTNNSQSADPKEEGTAALTTMALQWTLPDGGTVGGNNVQTTDENGNIVYKRKRHIVWFGDQPSHEGRVNRRSVFTDPPPETSDPIYAYYPTLAQTRSAVSYGKVRIHAIDCANLNGTGQATNLVSLTQGTYNLLSSDTAKDLANKLCAAIMEKKQGY